VTSQLSHPYKSTDFTETLIYNILYIVNTPCFDASAKVDVDASKTFCFLGEHSVILPTYTGSN